MTTLPGTEESKQAPIAAGDRRPPRRRGGWSMGRRVVALIALLVTIGGSAVVVAILFLALGGGGAAAVHTAEQGLLTRLQRPLVLPPLPQRSTIYAADGSQLQTLYFKFNRVVVPLKAIDKSTRDAVLAIEDHGFYQHGPIDIPSIIRAAIANLRAGTIVQGGSTISQQLVKNTFTGSAPTFQRKIREAEDAIRLERTYSKNQILDQYLNQIYLGNGVYGIAAAAQWYFAEKPSQLTLSQGALLAGMISSPTLYDPIVHPKAARTRRNEVLQRMLVLGWIGHGEYRKAVKAQIRLSSKERNLASSGPNSYWTQYVIGQFLQDPTFGKTFKERQHALFQGGLKIYTTLDPQLQRDAHTAIQRRMSQPGQPQSALVSVVPSTGAIVAMDQGNSPWGTYQYNLATDPGGGRTAGSAFKVFTLAAALENGISPNKVYSANSPTTIQSCGGGQTWHVANAEPVGGGSFPLWQATADSINVIFAQVINQIGPDVVAKVAHRMGITSPLTPVCPLTLGTSPVSPLEMTSGSATLANDGIHCQPYAIQKVLGPDGTVVEHTKPTCTRAMPASVARLETSMLMNVILAGTGYPNAVIGRPAAGKTGTGQNYQDAWFVGYVPQLATGVWVGNAASESPLNSVPGYFGPAFGGTVAAPIWHDFMIAALRGVKPQNFTGVNGPYSGGGGSVVSSGRPTPPSPSPSSHP